MNTPGTPNTFIQNPYPGPIAFNSNQKDLFFGRDYEAQELVSLISSNRVILVYARSGVGKSSLINAGIVPLLSPDSKQQIVNGFAAELLPISRVKVPTGIPIPGDTQNVFSYATLLNWRAGQDATQLCTQSLASVLRDLPHTLNHRTKVPLPRIAILDQFEELFTSHLERWRDRQGFFKQIHEAMHADPQLRVVMVIREEYLARLDEFAGCLPVRSWCRFRLERFDRTAALEAITKPLLSRHQRYAKGVAEALVRELLKERVQGPDGKIVDVVGQYIEPVHLQVLCRALWSPDVHEITHKNLRAIGNVDLALSHFYDLAVEAAARTLHAPGPAVELNTTTTDADESMLRRWCESNLITPFGTRSAVYDQQWQEEGIPDFDCAIRELESKYIIRGEIRSGIKWYELSHDRLIPAIRAANKNYLWGVHDRNVKAQALSHVIQDTAAQPSSNWKHCGDLPKPVLLAVTEHVSKYLPFDLCIASRYTADMNYSRVLFAYSRTDHKPVTFPTRWYHLPSAMASWVRQPDVSITEDLRTFFANPEWNTALNQEALNTFLQSGYESSIRYPLLRAGSVVASMSLYSKEKRCYTKEHASLLAALPIDIALLTSVYYEDTRDLQFRLDLIRSILRLRSNGEISHLLVQRLAEHYDWEGVYLFEVDEAMNQAVLQSQHVVDTQAELPENYTQSLAVGVLGEVYRERKDVNIPNTKIYRGASRSYVPPRKDFLSELCLRFSTNRKCWILNIEDSRENAFSAEEEDELRKLLATVAVVIERLERDILIAETFRATATSVVIVDTNGYIQEANPSASRLLRYPEEELIGSEIRKFFGDPTVVDAMLRTCIPVVQTATLLFGNGKLVEMTISGGRLEQSGTAVISIHPQVRDSAA